MMVSFHQTAFLLLIFIQLIRLIKCSGNIELVVVSPETVLMASTICTTSRCNSMDDYARKIKITSNIPFRTQDAPYNGEAPRYYDLHVTIFNINGEIIGSVFNSPDSDTTWQTGIIPTSHGFNVTIKYRNMCDNHYYGMRCNRFCQDSSELHTECSRSGERRCMQGWSGLDCMTPICEKSCNGRGRCVAPEQCVCKAGFTGAKCDECVAKRGCRHGGCANNTAFTCQCLPGYSGALCTKDLEKCNRERPCQNNGICINDRSQLGFKCQCPDGFVGDKCEIPIDNVKCEHENGETMCLNGGVCISLSEKSIECKCRPGFSGKFCEIGNGENSCGGLKCRNGAKCVLNSIEEKPKCECATCYRGDRCEIFDANCLVSRMNETIQATNLKNLEIQMIELKNHEDNGYGNILIIALILAVVMLASFVVFYFCTSRHCNNLNNRVTTEIVESSSPKCRKLTSSPVYKVCVIDAEMRSELEGDRSNMPQSPPPAYYPPVPRYQIENSQRSKKYQTLSTNDAPTTISKFSINATIV